MWACKPEGIEMAGLAGRAFVAIWHDIVPEGRAEFYAWHTREHMPERLGVAGFLRGRRYLAERGSPAYFNLYEVDSPDVLTGAEYLERLNNPTVWTQRALPYFRNVSRSLCRVGASFGRSEGGAVLTVRVDAACGREEIFSHFLEVTLRKLFDEPGIVGAHFGVADRTGSAIVTAERKARGDATLVPGWVILLEGVSATVVDEAAQGLTALKEYTVPGTMEQSIYRLECALSRAACLGAPPALRAG
jgi:hypothetical protein